MSAGPSRPRPAPEFDPDASGLMDRAAAVLRIYTRAFLSQGVGLVGLAWCLSQNLPFVALGLAVLVLADQAVFLRGRAPLPQARGLQRGLDLWCLAVSAADLLILFAAAFRATGLREIGGGPVSDPLSCLAFAVAVLARLDLGLAPLGGAGRLVAAGEALFGDALLLWALAALGRAAFKARAVRQP
ncbi:hypothetical protein P7D22_16200 [Lichenihabitans sp. Uapishka_5]|uniref:hypothetical protein n=1 Tax=Lichenihabitans sp. Uapishka_5 TaxID=3037302 RepID=UPI0029E7FB94|nr:hypothetical protein [Lichenihabitans sp. Uapishka_5]MDX7952710.1 hypothetical protein [Lichenihabitans sp. Uapishka_5]